MKALEKEPLTRRQTQAERKASSERRLLEAAAELVAEGGIAATTFEKVGARAGCSRGLVSQRFGSKDGLIAALVTDLKEQFEQEIAESRLDQLAPHEALIAFVDLYFSALWERPTQSAYHVLLAESISSQPELRPLFANVHDHVRDQLRGFIERAQTEGTIPASIDADATALSVGALLLGMTIQSIVNPTTDVDRVRRNAVTTLRGALQMA
jgi:AcrR family transcriptional regulator